VGGERRGQAAVEVPGHRQGLGGALLPGVGLADGALQVVPGALQSGVDGGGDGGEAVDRRGGVPSGRAGPAVRALQCPRHVGQPAPPGGEAFGDGAERDHRAAHQRDVPRGDGRQPGLGRKDGRPGHRGPAVPGGREPTASDMTASAAR
jgi:hypothetical protein